jgi:hypothetical protein
LGCSKISKLIDKYCVYDFLTGLNIEYDDIRVWVMWIESFSSFRQIYSHVQQEKSMKNIMLHLDTHKRSMIGYSIRGFTRLSW